MSKGNRRRAGRPLQLLRGDGGESLCVWEPHQVRGTHEARLLAVEGCPHRALEPSEAMEQFVTDCGLRFGAVLGPVHFERGRVHAVAHTAEARRELGSMRALARTAGLSHLDAHGAVHVRLRAADRMAIIALLRVLASGGAAAARLCHGDLRLSLRRSPEALLANVRVTDSPRMQRAVRLLGFRASAHGAHRRSLELEPCRAARALVDVLLHTCGDGELEARLFAPHPVLHRPREPPPPRESAQGKRG